MHSLLYFNGLLLFYNACFIVYSTFSFNFDAHPDGLLFLSFISCLQIFILTNFSVHYYRLARIMHIFFNKDIAKQLKATTKKGVRRNRIALWTFIVVTYSLAIIGLTFRVIGQICI